MKFKATDANFYDKKNNKINLGMCKEEINKNKI